MKCLTVFMTLIFSLGLLAKESDRQILRCLGTEEKRLHQKKNIGPVYDLNQRLISEMVQIPRVEVRSEDYVAICAGEKFSESWRLLERSMQYGKVLFVLPNDLTDMQKEMTVGMIDDYVEATREIFLSFISQIQTQSPTPTCLKEEIPELDALFFEIKYLQEDVDMKVILKGKEKILGKLKNYPLAFEKCRARLKKKPKPSSTEAPKKS